VSGWSEADDSALAELAEVLAPHVDRLARQHAERVIALARPRIGAGPEAIDALATVSRWLFGGLVEGLRSRNLQQLFQRSLEYNVELLRSQREVDPELRSTLAQLYISLEISTSLIFRLAQAQLGHSSRLPAVLAAYGRVALHLGNIVGQAFYEVRAHEMQEALDVRTEAAAAARDVERRRLGRELHDATLQDLGAVKLGIETVMRHLPAAGLEPALETLVQTILQIRRLVEDLRPADVSAAGLHDAIASYARIMTQPHDITLDVQVGDGGAVPEWAARDLYRIAQEAIANAVRHAAPRRMEVRLVEDGTQVVLSVRDDGAGFDPRHAVLGGGIRGMRERAAALGVYLTIHTAPGAGTEVRVAVPGVAPVAR
jgi:signal transduction histidine kinase